MMRQLIIVLSLIVGLMSACDTEQKVIDTGVSNPYFDGTMMEYMRAKEAYWDLTIQLIERADLVNLFEGRVDSCREITFFAPPSYAILRFLLDTQAGKVEGVCYKEIADIPVEQCKQYVLSHVVKGKHLKETIGFINKDYLIGDARQDGGSDFTTLAGNRLRVYLQKSAWAGVPDVGPVSMGLFSLTRAADIPVATPDIQPHNGVIHALHTGYDFGKI